MNSCISIVILRFSKNRWLHNPNANLKRCFAQLTFNDTNYIFQWRNLWLWNNVPLKQICLFNSHLCKWCSSAKLPPSTVLARNVSHGDKPGVLSDVCRRRIKNLGYYLMYGITKWTRASTVTHTCSTALVSLWAGVDRIVYTTSADPDSATESYELILLLPATNVVENGVLFLGLGWEKKRQPRRRLSDANSLSIKELE